METKYCKDCQLDLPFSEFGKWKYGKNGLKHYCKKCKKLRDTKERRDKGQKERFPLVKDEEGKQCSNCKEYKLFSNFSPSKIAKDGKESWCKVCKVEIGKLYRVEKGIKPKLYRQEKDGLFECLECKTFLSKENFSPSKRGSFGLCSYCKSCVIKKFKQDKPTQNARAKKFRAKGTYRPAHRIRQFNRNNLIKAVDDGTVTKDFVLGLLKLEICSYCKDFTEEQYRTLDHVVPLNKGGIHSSTNLVMACLSCNSTKRDLMLEEFLEKYVQSKSYSG